MTILLDNGHGQNTPGKRSPDGFFREYAYTRFLAKQIQEHLIALGLDARILVPELDDISLPERSRGRNLQISAAVVPIINKNPRPSVT